MWLKEEIKICKQNKQTKTGMLRTQVIIKQIPLFQRNEQKSSKKCRQGETAGMARKSLALGSEWRLLPWHSVPVGRSRK